MTGLVEARDNPELFAGSTRCGGRFRRTGAATVCKIKLNVYQQLMRFKHMVNNIMKKSPSHENFDKLFHVRPMITMLQQTFERWFNPPKDNSMDEAGIPSRSKWMRTFNGSKPYKYFIELLMACCATTRFCWAFFVTESALKTIMNRHRRGRNKSKFKKVVHYQYEYSDVERRFQDRFGSATAQMLYFARILRERHPSQVTYRLFVDRRWDSLSAIVLAKKNFNISFTTTVKFASRYHIISHWGGKGGRGKAIVKSKKRNRRGKYRSATTTISGVVINECLWNDSSLLGGCSADLGCEDQPVKRRMGRHTPTVSCPRMMAVRGDKLRGVDIHDQLRSSKYRMTFQCRNKAWPKLDIGLFEILVVNIYCVKKTSEATLKPDDYRWDLLNDMVLKADQLEAEKAARVARVRPPTTRARARAKSDDKEDSAVGRFAGVDVHHHDRICEYVTPEQVKNPKKSMIPTLLFVNVQGNHVLVTYDAKKTRFTTLFSPL